MGKSHVMLSTSIEFAVDHVVLDDESTFAGSKLRAALDVTNSKCNFHRKETRSIENVGVHDNGMEIDRCVSNVDKVNSDCLVYDVTLDN